MITIKAVIRPDHLRHDDTCNVNIRIICNRKVKYLPTNIYLEPKFFDNPSGKVKMKHPNYKNINALLDRTITEYQNKLMYLPGSATMEMVLPLLEEVGKPAPDFFSFTANRENRLRELGKYSSADLLKYTAAKIKEFTTMEKLEFAQIDYKFLAEFEIYLQKQGLKINAVSVYLRNIRIIYNNAIDEGLVELNLYPFRRFKIRSESTRKRNIELETLRKIKNFELDGVEEYARDMFLLSFYLLGINFIDLYYLGQLKAGRVEYRRKKTGKLYSVKVLPPAMKIIKKYPGKEYLMDCSERYNSVYQFRKSTNKFLDRIRKRLKIADKITTYYARHTWATIASDMDIAKEIISAALGHESGNPTTDIYIDFDLKKVDRANEKIIKVL